MAMIPLLRLFLLITGLLLSLLTLGSLLGGLHWTLDVLSHFHLHYLFLLVAFLLLLLLLPRARWQALLLLPGLLLNLALVLPFFSKPVSAISSDESLASLRVMTLNISTSTLGYPDVVALIRERAPDIVFMSEVREDLVALLQAELATDYPLLHAVPSRHTLGLAVLARDPSVGVQTMTMFADSGRRSRRYLQADFDWQGQQVSLVGLHPLPPMRASWAEGRDQELALMADLAQEADHPYILLGDLNAAPWSSAMRSLIKKSGLRYAAKGFGIWPTWFVSQARWGRILGAPLDHILVSAHWQVEDYTLAGDIASDHVPLQADLRLSLP